VVALAVFRPIFALLAWSFEMRMYCLLAEQTWLDLLWIKWVKTWNSSTHSTILL